MLNKCLLYFQSQHEWAQFPEMHCAQNSAGTPNTYPLFVLAFSLEKCTVIKDCIISTKYIQLWQMCSTDPSVLKQAGCLTVDPGHQPITSDLSAIPSQLIAWVVSFCGECTIGVSATPESHFATLLHSSSTFLCCSWQIGVMSALFCYHCLRLSVYSRVLGVESKYKIILWLLFSS